MEIVASNQIHIRSKDCIAIDEAITTNFEITLETPISCYNDEMIVVSLTTAEIPYTFFGVNNTNNFVEFQEYDYNGSYSNPRTIISLQITNGNYNIYQLKDELIKQMNLNSVFTNPYSSTYDDITNTLTITITGDNIGCSILCNTGVNKTKRIFRQLGFSSIQDFQFNTSISSDGNVDLATIHSLYLRTDLGLVNTYSSSTKNLTNILSKIPINCDSLEMIYFKPIDKSGFNLLQQNNIRHFTISLTDQNDNIIDLGRNINWELTIIFDIVRKPKRTYTPYNTIDFNDEINISTLPKTKSLPINDLYNRPIRDFNERPQNIQNKIELIRRDDIKQDNNFNKDIDNMENKIKDL